MTLGERLQGVVAECKAIKSDPRYYRATSTEQSLNEVLLSLAEECAAEIARLTARLEEVERELGEALKPSNWPTIERWSPEDFVIAGKKLEKRAEAAEAQVRELRALLKSAGTELTHAANGATGPDNREEYRQMAAEVDRALTKRRM